mmetsp:Transcript_19309/g.21879  ORF Transcript_19309/g.21879 Transcript_19309/m.21879 type:complete len:674 (+) Transcript_19309:211-2232(+)
MQAKPGKKNDKLVIEGKGGSSLKSSKVDDQPRDDMAVTPQTIITETPEPIRFSNAELYRRRLEDALDPLPLIKTTPSGNNNGLAIEDEIQNSVLNDLQLPVKTGHTQATLKRNPRFVGDIDEVERLYVPGEDIVQKSVEHDNDKLAKLSERESLNVVYDCSNPSPYHENVVMPQTDDLPFYYILRDSSDETLLFESRFESGNLRRAIKVDDYEYDLIVRPDYNTKGVTQWYFFSVANTRRGHTYRFNLINFLKPDSLYNYGLKPLIYSETEAKRYGMGWHREGSDICYFQSQIKRRGAGYFYTLSFTINFQHDQDVVYFAHCYPYTYTDLHRDIGRLLEDPYRKNWVRRRVLCKTIAENDCDLLVITNFSSEPEKIRSRKGIVISSRVHPGESNASWMMKGFLDFLTGSSLDANILRDNFVFKIVPMLNPDGVINGNYRCSLAGVDLNRTWSDPSKRNHPTIYHTKLMIKKFQDDREVVLICDLHGHSRNKNFFMYGNSGKPGVYRLQEKIFPFLMQKNSSFFNFNDCGFQVQKSKESTARVVGWKELGITNCYTLEASFCGADIGMFSDLHFNLKHLQQIAHHFCQTILDMFDPDQTKVKDAINELELLYPKIEEDECNDGNDNSGGDSDFSGNDDAPKKKKTTKKKTTTTKKKSSKKNDEKSRKKRESNGQ